MLALGGQLKVTFALGRDRHAVLSHHIGDLDHYEAYRAYVEAIAHYERLFAIRPELLAHDLHPDYASTRYARAMHAGSAPDAGPSSTTTPIWPVAWPRTAWTNRSSGSPSTALAIGTDGAVWGGEFLMGDYRGFRRAAHCGTWPCPAASRRSGSPGGWPRPTWPTPGWTTASLQDRVAARRWPAVRRQIERRFNAPLDLQHGPSVRRRGGVGRRAAIASATRARRRSSSKGWPPESAADGVYPFELEDWFAPDHRHQALDRRGGRRRRARASARRSSAAGSTRHWSRSSRRSVAGWPRRDGLATVVLSGGVFLNALLTREDGARLARDGFRVYRHRRVPPSDGGLSLGQLAIAAAWQRVAIDPDGGTADVPGDPRQGRGDLSRSTTC